MGNTRHRYGKSTIDIENINLDRGAYIVESDNNVVIQAKIDAANATLQNPFSIIFAPGAYEFADAIEIPSDVKVEFMNGVYIRIADTNDLDDQTYTKSTENVACIITNNDHANGNENIRIVGDVTIDFESPTGAGNIGAGLKYEEDRHYTGIWLNNCNTSKIEGVRVDDIVYDISGYQGFGILLTDCSDVDVVDCTVNGAAYEGIGIRGGNQRINVVRARGEGNKNHLSQVAHFWESAAVIADGAGSSNTYIAYSDCQSETNGIAVHTLNESILTITAVDTGNDTFTVAGEIAGWFTVGQKFAVEGSTGNDGYWEVESVAESTNTVVTVTGDITDATVDGSIYCNHRNITMSNCHCLQARLLGDSWAMSVIGGSYEWVKVDTLAGNMRDVLINGIQLYYDGTGTNAGAIEFVNDDAGSILRATINNCMYSDFVDSVNGLDFIRVDQKDGSGTASGDIQDLVITGNNVDARTILYRSADGTSSLSKVTVSGNSWQGGLYALAGAEGSNFDKVIMSCNQLAGTWMLAGTIDKLLITGNHLDWSTAKENGANITNATYADNIENTW
jgi:hypothetical protein